MKNKIISIITILSLLINLNIVNYVNAVDTNEQATPWTIQKAEHLAKKVLYGVTEEKVTQLFNAGSASNAVDILFPSIAGPDRTAYDIKMDTLLDEDLLIKTSDNNMREFYTFKKLEDPYEAKSKLFSIFEDTFSVDTINERINYGDIEETHNLIYEKALGNYKDIIKSILYNDGSVGDYSLGEYLDLFNQSNPKYPNENYSREILQLFLMLEYIPTESEDNGAIRNYSEDDVNALAKILFGFEADENTHNLVYNNTANTNLSVEFLEGDLKSGDIFPFYNTASGIVDIQLLKQSISGNNGLPDNTIDYIFSKRENEIAMFVADKFYRFYVAENPTKTDVQLIADRLILNNFEIYPTVKWLLSNKIMYTEKSMNGIIYKNPLELIIGTSKILGLNSDNLDLRYSLNNLNWTPYAPHKIFGRDGFDQNAIFFTPYLSNKWTSESSKLATKMIQTNSGFISQELTAELFLSDLENKIFLGKTLDADTKAKLLNFLTHDKDGVEIPVDYSDQNYINNNIHGVIYMMLNMPEYVLQSGYDNSESENNSEEEFYTNDNKLVFMKASGGLDWMHALIPKDEYNDYLELRGTGALTGTGIQSLNDEYYMNSSLAPLKDLFNSGNIKLINRVGTPDHSRGHDSASRKITSLNNKYADDEGIFGHFIKNEDPSKTIVLGGGTKPSILREGNYMGIGSSALFSVDLGNNDNKNYKINTLKDVLENRIYNGDFGKTFINSSKIDSVAKDSKANGGREGSGYNMNQKFTFLESLYNADLGNTAWLRADGGYDTHRNQKDYLSNNLSKIATQTANFFNNVKDTENITIVLYSEFGRTNKLNSSLGVDHGMAGGMIIISNNDKLINTNFKEEVYGNLSMKDSRSNWLGVGIDYRSVYSGIIDALYGINTELDFGGIFDINSYIDTTESDIELLNINHRNSSNTRSRTEISFDINDDNFHPSQASYVKFEYGKDLNTMYEYTTYYIKRYMKINENNVRLFISNTYPGDKYFYKVTLYDNQYNEKIIEGDFISPEITSAKELKKDKPTRINQYTNLTVSGSIDLTSSTSSGITLSNTGIIEFDNGTDTKLIAGSGTYITSLESEEESVWDGTFNLPKELSKEHFLSKKAKLNNVDISNSKVIKIIKIGADNLGIKMNLNKKIDVEVKNIPSEKNYKVIFSNNGITWQEIDKTNITKGVNKLIFKTNHFTHYIILETNNSGEIIDEGEEESSDSGSSNGSGGGSSTPRLIKDVCPYGDYSISYYDRICGNDPYIYDPSHWNPELNLDNEEGLSNMGNTNNSHMKKEIENAYIEIKMREEIEKSEVYDELFLEKEIEKKETEENLLENNILDGIITEEESQISILTLLREKMSEVFIGKYKLIHIKESTLNKNFEKIGIIILRKKFSTQKEEILFKMLNKIIVYSAIHKTDLVSEEIKSENKILLMKQIKEFISEIKKKESINVLPINKEVRKETLEEKIRRINKRKQELKKAGVAA